MTVRRPRLQSRTPWPTSLDVLRLLAGVLVPRGAGRPTLLKSKQTQRLLRGETSKLSPQRVVQTLEALTTRFLLEDRLVLVLHTRTEEDLAVLVGAPNVEALRTACLENSQIRAFVAGARDPLPAVKRATRMLFEHMLA